ncbi:MAG: glycine cleavage T C-terminal barrel domain-containing protein, partial [Paracoccaceae bacterium]
QTSMRIEKGFCAMGHELDSDVTPIDAGLGFATRKSGGFIGADALAAQRDQNAPSRMVSLRISDKTAVPLGHEPVYLGDRIIGQTTSASYGYRLDCPVALALLKAPVGDGTTVAVDIAGVKFAAQVVLGPLFDATGARLTLQTT